MKNEIATLQDIVDRQSSELQKISVAIGSNDYLDLPDGGSVELAEQVRRMRAEIARLREENGLLELDKSLLIDEQKELIEDVRRLREERDALSAKIEAAQSEKVSYIALLTELHDNPYHHVRDFKPRIDALLYEAAPVPAQVVMPEIKAAGEYMTGDEQLDLLLSLNDDLVSGEGNHDTAAWWHETLNKVVARLNGLEGGAGHE